MSNFKKKKVHKKEDIKPLTDLELIRLGIRNEPLIVDKEVFIKNPEEKEKLKKLKKEHKKYEASLED